MQRLRPQPEAEREESQQESRQRPSRLVVTMPEVRAGVARTSVFVVHESNMVSDAALRSGRTLSGIGPAQSHVSDADPGVLVSRVMRVFEAHADAPTDRSHRPLASSRPGLGVEPLNTPRGAVATKQQASAAGRKSTSPRTAPITEKPDAPTRRRHAGWWALAGLLCVALGFGAWQMRAALDESSGSGASVPPPPATGSGASTPESRAGALVADDGSEALAAADGLDPVPLVRHADARNQPLVVSTIDAEIRPMPRYMILTGTLTPDTESKVAANVAGKVLEIRVERGSHVDAGSVLAVVDRSGADNSERDAAAAIQVARVQADLARTNCERAAVMLANGAISQQEFDRSEAERDTAKLALAKAQTRHSLTLKNLADAVIRAPFSGVVSERFIDVGERVEAHSPIVHLLSQDSLRLRVSVPERLVPRVSRGMSLELRVAAEPNTWFPATLRYVSESLRPRTRDLVAEAVVSNSDKKLRAGMFAVARVPIYKSPVTVVPEDSVRFDGERTLLFVDHHGRLQERIVEVGTRDARLVEVRSGVTPGEAVVTPFNPAAKDGAPVAR